jgi:hypothetical protein
MPLKYCENVGLSVGCITMPGNAGLGPIVTLHRVHPQVLLNPPQRSERLQKGELEGLENCFVSASQKDEFRIVILRHLPSFLLDCHSCMASVICILAASLESSVPSSIARKSCEIPHATKQNRRV